MKVLVAIYSHPEYYPPTLNAIELLSKNSTQTIVICRNLLDSKWKYASNVKLITSGKKKGIRDSEKDSNLNKLLAFINFSILLFKTINMQKSDIVVLYDPLGAFSFYVSKIFLKCTPLIWYHNHDVIELKSQRRFSIGWFSIKFQKNTFSSFNIFSLPSQERKLLFPLNRFKGNYFFLPNWPSLKFYLPFYSPKAKPNTVIKLLYQGSVSEGHGLEAILSILASKISGLSLSLTLIGWIRDSFRMRLLEKAKELKVEKQLYFLAPVPYSLLPSITSQFDIGLAIHEPTGINFMTAGSASNKIYEYAALGLPVILYDTPHYRKNLENYSWAFFTNLSESSLKSIVNDIICTYEELSLEAHNDFSYKLNFEYNFQNILDHIRKLITHTHL